MDSPRRTLPLRPARHPARLGAVLLLPLVLAACAGPSARVYAPIDLKAGAGDFGGALAELEAVKETGKFRDKDRLLYFLDSGFLAHHADSLRLSNERLSLAEDTAEEMFTKSVTKAALTMVLNDNVLDYSGEDYEILYTNTFKALNYAASEDFQGALVEVRRANEKLELLEQKYVKLGDAMERGAARDTTAARIDYEAKKVRFNNSAFARYLGMHLYAARGDWDDARIDREGLEDAFRTQPHIYDHAVPDVSYRADGQAVLSVVGFAGLSPRKTPLNLRIFAHKESQTVTVQYDGVYIGQSGGDYAIIPFPVEETYYFKFSIPQISPQPSVVKRVRVTIDGREAGDLEVLEDVGNIAVETFEAKKSLIYLRTVARAIVKGLAFYKQEQKLKADGVPEWLAKGMLGVLAEAIEAADVRGSHYLPGRILVRDFPVDPGLHGLRIEFLDAAGGVVHLENIPAYEVRASGPNFVEATCLK